ncbi:unnamed protein product [Meloidogyne enterolobii]|uniref:Uncharacterized protein n=1 Tax=Meloidogyne enterolobii TaxID=390850 RepID=A0ACB1ANT7_MELEN
MNADHSNHLQNKEKEGGENDGNNNKTEESGRQLISVALPVRRVKQGKIGKDSIIVLNENDNTISYDPMLDTSKMLCGCSKKEKKTVSLFELLEIRQGYRTDNWHRAVRMKRFQETAPEDHCFSIIFKHPRFVCKSLDFIAFDKNKALEWVEELRLLLNNKENGRGGKKEEENFSKNNFNENWWLLKNFKNADLDKNGKIGFNELWKLLKRLNLQLSELYVKALFKETLERNGQQQQQNQALDQKEFLHLFSVLTDLPEYKNALRLANDEGNDWLDANSLLKFLREEQEFKEIDLKKAEAIIDFCEPGGQEIGRAKILTINGFRRLLQSCWGNILREGHETVFMDMDQPLHCYFINSSHNTYLTGLQVHGNATIEGYICALKKGCRLLELDIFDGENGEPQITHKHTFIAPISLRNVLNCIKQYAFIQSLYPIILTIENHVSPLQQGKMAEIFVQVSGMSRVKKKSNWWARPEGVRVSGLLDQLGVELPFLSRSVRVFFGSNILGLTLSLCLSRAILAILVRWIKGEKVGWVLKKFFFESGFRYRVPHDIPDKLVLIKRKRVVPNRGRCKRQYPKTRRKANTKANI